MAMVLDLFVQTTMGKLAVAAEQKACKLLGVKEEIKKLQRRLMRISSFLEDAERRRHTDAVINTWVKELRDIMYAADDIVDVCMLEGGKLLEFQPHPSSSSLPGFFFPLSFLSSGSSCVKYRREIANQIEQLNDRIKEIADDNQVIPNLVESNSQASQGSIISSRATSPVQVDSDIVGKQIEVAADGIVKSMLEDGQKRCQVYGILGMGGIGKTTLARKIFNDQKIKDNFPTRIWLYVSKHYSMTKLYKELIRVAKGDDDGAESIAELEQKLVSTFHSNKRKILLVLDDLWSANVWNDQLRTPVVSSGVISKILITSRYASVGRAMGATNNHIHHVEKLDGESGWELLKNIAFKDGDEIMMHVLKEVGFKIVEKCDGLPLAIKVIAGILCCKEKTQGEWEKVLKSDIWRMNQIDNEIPRALYLSYEDLSSELKSCFLSCALFVGFTSYYRIVYHWMAEGLIVEQQSMSMEELAEDYYRELFSRNLLQSHPYSVDGSMFMMHDSLRALATNLMEEGIMIGEGETLNINKPLAKIRWLSMSNKRDNLTLPSAIKGQNCLRVLILYDSPGTKTIEDNLFKILGHLRVLDLSNTSIGSIPNTIGELLHLRCLNLDETNICEVPESIGHLRNLQTLSMQLCLSLYRLPNSITTLCNLRSLSLCGTPLIQMPKGIRKLTNINRLEGFIVSRNDSTSNEGCDLEELQCLSNLRFLHIWKFERASNKGGTIFLANQTFLKQLCIGWTKLLPAGNSNGAPSASDEKQILKRAKIMCRDDDDDNNDTAPSTGDEEQIIKRAESLCSQHIPPSSLQELFMYNFPGRQFPSWIMSTSLGASFPHLTCLALQGIPLCTMLPPLGQLRQLKRLLIKGALGIKRIGLEFLGGHCSARFPAFPTLVCLQFIDMPNWEEWALHLGHEEENVGDKRNPLKPFPNLTKCVLISCSRLIALPDQAFYHATNLKELHVELCGRLERIPNLPSLKHMRITGCSSLKHLGNVGGLQILRLICPPQDHEFLPQWLLDLVTKQQHNLVDFQMTCSLSLLKSCLKGKLNWYIVRQILDVYIKTIDNMHWMRYTKDPSYYNTTVQ